ncbi:MAG: helix-turn-helix transcriptional regulator, partial [Proteobacteria bacterium]|nr:helix-turn-helix transcriptional regulator [Pseudomonadota bacterium]
YDYPCHSPERYRWFYMRAVLMADEGPLRVIISHEDITQLKLAQEALKENQKQLEDKNQSLSELNTALKVLIRQREEDKAEMEKKFLANVKTLILPYISRLKEGRLGEKDKTLVNIIDDHLKDIISPLMRNIKNADIMLTPQEIQVASLVKDGKTTSEIADILFVSEATISFHRKNLRVKLGLKNRQMNLRSFLLSMS